MEHSSKNAYFFSFQNILPCKVKSPLELIREQPSLNLRQSGCEFFTHFQEHCVTEEWEYFINKKILPLHNNFTAGFLKTLRDKSNIYWAECYEEAKVRRAT